MYPGVTFYDGLGSVRQMTNSLGAVHYAANGLVFLCVRYANLDISSFLTRDPVLNMAK